ncbi:hypothetical protein AB1L16_07165 [Peribacillus frigoritolerans]|uniref:hypothetical protein n=1 Tax=Peribacillus frigoritolerans TaxID=450367 RepID=UPI0039A103AB
MERKVRDSCEKSLAKGDPAGERRGGSRTARGKRVPGVEIITYTPFGNRSLTADCLPSLHSMH